MIVGLAYVRRFSFNSAIVVQLFPLLSNITCVVVEQFFYLMCISLYLRLKLLHNDINALVHRAKHTRWKCWVNPNADYSRPTLLGIPAFGASDVRELRAVHAACMELFARINCLFQLPLLLCMFDCIFHIIIYIYVTIVIWEKKNHVNYVNVAISSSHCVIRVIRLWHLHLCEHYVTKKVCCVNE